MEKWYKELDLLRLNLKSLQEDIPINLRERSHNGKDLELFDMQLNAMRARLDRALNELNLKNTIE